MLSFAEVAVRSEFAISKVVCRHDHTGWSAVESGGDYRLVLVRHGRFRRRAADGPATIDPTMAYVGVPGEEEHFAHPAGGDTCTLVTLIPGLWHSLAGDRARPARSTVYVDARLDLAHRRLLAGARDLDEVIDHLMILLGHVVRQATQGPAPVETGLKATVAAAREAIDSGHPASRSLTALAGLLGVSPYSLSRAFTRELGVTLTRYRHRVRLGRALDRLERGEPSLAGLAAELGYADQAHMCRAMKETLGHPPAALRRMLSRM